MRRIAAPTAPRCRNTLQRKRASPWMPNERSSSLSSSNFCFCVSLRMLYASRCVSWGVNCSNWVSWVRRPLIRSCGYVPLVMWRSDPPRHAREAARRAALALVERDLAVPGRGVAVGDERLLVDLVGFPARAAHLASETLGQDQQERGRDEERRDSHVQEPRDGRGAVVRVERGEDEVAGERGADRDLRRLEIARLADQDHVRVLAQERAERGGEGPPHALVDLHLVDA